MLCLCLEGVFWVSFDGLFSVSREKGKKLSTTILSSQLVSSLPALPMTKAQMVATCAACLLST